jgi:hypothetical protein
MIVALVVLAAGLTATTLMAAQGGPAGLIAATAVVGLVWAGLAMRERSQLRASAASRSKVAAASARNMGFVWLWGALALVITYLFILKWHEWWQFALAFGVAGALSLALSALLERDATAGRDDAAMLKLARYLAFGQLAGMAAAVIGLIIDPDKELLWPNEGDWAANIIFLGGALTLAAITLHALLTEDAPSAPKVGA